MSDSFVQHLSFLLKRPIRACRRVRVYSPHWLLVSALFLFFIVVGQGSSSHPFFYYLTSLQQSFSYVKNPTATYSLIGSLSSNGPTFSKYFNMLICSTCRFRQLATHMSCSVMQDIPPISSLSRSSSRRRRRPPPKTRNTQKRTLTKRTNSH